MKPSPTSSLDACRVRYRNSDRSAHHHRNTPGPDLSGMAKASGAHYLVTGDKKGLLALAWIDNTRIITARQFIDAISV